MSPLTVRDLHINTAKPTGCQRRRDTRTRCILKWNSQVEPHIFVLYFQLISVILQQSRRVVPEAVRYLLTVEVSFRRKLTEYLWTKWFRKGPSPDRIECFLSVDGHRFSSLPKQHQYCWKPITGNAPRFCFTRHSRGRAGLTKSTNR